MGFRQILNVQGLQENDRAGDEGKSYSGQGKSMAGLAVSKREDCNKYESSKGYERDRPKEDIRER